MTFPSGTTLNTSNLDSSADDPSLARADLLATVEAVNAIIDSENSASGVVVLTASGRIPSGVMPSQITLPAGQGAQVINPGDGIVNIRDYLRLQPLFKVDVEAFEDMALGDMCLIQDGGASSDPVLAFYTGSKWVYLALADMTDL